MFFCLNEECSMDCDHYRLFFAMQERVAYLPKPAITQLVEEFGPEPFLVLVATLLSLRARDTVTLPLAKLVYERFPTPRSLAFASYAELSNLIRPIGFFRVKAKTLIRLSTVLVQQYGGHVPQDEAALLSLPGVGRKTANLLRAEVFGIPAICVDTHVHRISNHFGWVKTNTPVETERELMKLFSENFWIAINRILVPWGQYICRPRARVCVCHDLMEKMAQKK